MLLAKEVHVVTRTFPKEEIYRLVTQIEKCAVSIPSNIAEGSQRGSTKEFIHFIGISRGSLAELETQLLLAETFTYITAETMQKFQLQIEEVSKMLYAFLISLKKTVH